MSKLGRNHVVYLMIFVLALAGHVVSGELEAFEAFYEYSRAHEDWDLDELFTLVFLSAFAFLLILIVRSRELARALRERDTAERAAQSIARRDMLSGLPNRRALEEHLDQIADRPDPGSAGDVITLLIDLDRFKQVNDLHGHPFGDAVLRNATDRILGEIDATDFAARLGGDEFVVVLGPGASPNHADRIARRLLTKLEQPFEHEGVRVNIGASIGLSSCAISGIRTTALRTADQALYAAKDGGRNRIAWYDDDLDAKTTENAAIMSDLRQAIKAGEIVPYFQPIFEIESNNIRGFEVLARWTHPTRGQIAPDIFIAIAEDTGLIVPLGLSILRQACLEAKDWDRNLQISVNVSPLQFRDSTMVSRISDVLAQTGFDPHRLEIEITESAIIQNFEAVRDAIEALRDMGVSIALDDFGTGFSSISYLRQLHFDRVKIDRSFVTDIANTPKNQKLTSGILALAKGLELSVTAEGIETASDRDFLQSLDCALGQGFWFEKALTAEKINWLLNTTWSSQIWTGTTTPVPHEPQMREIQQSAS